MKQWLKSKTLWVNIIAVSVIIAQGQFGYVITPELQVGVLATINFVLRLISKEDIVWK